MPSRFIVRRTARAVGITCARPSRSTSASASVAIASISGTIELRALLLDQPTQRDAVGHRDHVRAMRDLMAGGVRVAVDRDDLDPQSLQRDDHFLAELAAAEQHDLGRGRGKRRADWNRAGLKAVGHGHWTGEGKLDFTPVRTEMLHRTIKVSTRLQLIVS